MPTDSNHPTRRGFLGAAVAGAIAAPAFAHGAAVAPATRPTAPGTFAEPGRDIPLADDADVIVCGGGPAGVTAAITAGRAGARVRLFDVNGCLGGVWTAGYLGYLLDFNKPGFAKELTGHLEAWDARRGSGAGSIAYEPEEMKLLLEELAAKANVRFQLHTRVVAAHRDGRRLTTIVTESKSGRQAWAAPAFVDATGDGDVGALAGCAWEVGQSADCPCQPMSLNALLVVRDASRLEPFLHHAAPNDGRNTAKAKDLLFAEIKRAGFEPSYAKPTLWQVRDNLLLVMMNHEYGVKPFDAAAVTAATVRARAEMNGIVKALRKLGGPWDGVQLAATAEHIGVRDGRRIRGRYVVTKEDAVSGARHADGVARATFPVDVHAVAPGLGVAAAASSHGIKVKPYDIPLRAMIAADVDGLMMAGRCISGDFIAHSSYRVTGNAVAMGEAAGAVATIAAQSKRMPHDVTWEEGATLLAKIGQRT